MKRVIPETMKAMRLHGVTQMSGNDAPLELEDVEVPRPGPREVLIRIIACGVCHTELDEIEGRTAPPRLPVIPGHQVVGEIVESGPQSDPGSLGKLVGVAWIYSACGHCTYCEDGLENLCAEFTATGRDKDGGYAQFMVAPAEFVTCLPDGMDVVYAAPLLCAGAVGYRSLKLAGISGRQSLGLTGFGASAHLVLQMSKSLYPAARIAVFARDEQDRNFARSLGAEWAGDTGDDCPFGLDAIIDTTPAWLPVTSALKQLNAGGKLVINAIRKEDHDRSALLDLDYASQLWMEKSVRSVANVTRNDVKECLELAARSGIRPTLTRHELRQANHALSLIKQGGTTGAHVLIMDAD